MCGFLSGFGRPGGRVVLFLSGRIVVVVGFVGDTLKRSGHSSS